MSRVLLASLKSAVDAETFLISANAGPSQIAGELCSPWFFSTSWQGDQVPQAIGEYMNQKGVKSAYPDRAELCCRQGRDRGPEGELQGHDSGRGIYPLARPARLLRRAFQGARRQARCDLRLLSRRRRRAVPDAICASRAEAADSALHVLHHRRPVAAAAEGSGGRRSRARSTGWSTLPNEANKKFVADFKNKYNRDAVLLCGTGL